MSVAVAAVVPEVRSVARACFRPVSLPCGWSCVSCAQLVS